MTEQHHAAHPSMDVEVFLRLSQEEDAYLCEIVAGGARSAREQGIQGALDPGGDLAVTAEAPLLERYTLRAPRQTKKGRRREQAEQEAFARLVQWIAAVLRQVTGADRASALALGSPPGRRAAHWLIAPLCDAADKARPAPVVLGMEQLVLPLSERGTDALARHIRRALAR